MKIAEGAAKVLPVAGAVEVVERLGGAVARRQHRGPQGDQRIEKADADGVPAKVGNDGTVGGLAHGEGDRRAVLDLDGLGAGGERFGAIGRQIGAGLASRCLLDDQIGGIGAGGGKGPADRPVMAQDVERRAGQGGAGQVEPGGGNPGQVPKIGGPEAEMRIAGDDRFAGCAARPGHGPGIGGGGGGGRRQGAVQRVVGEPGRWLRGQMARSGA